MVLNMADFCKSWKSPQTLRNPSKTVLKWFVTACATFCVDLGWIRKGRKLADFEQKSCAIAHGFEHGLIWQSWKSLQALWNSCKTVLKRFLTACATVCVDLGWICKGRKLADFEQKAWAIAHDLRMADFCKSRKSLQTLWNAAKTVLKWFVTACATVCVDLGSIPKGRKLADFDQKAGAIAHGFEHGRFWQMLEIAPNSLKRRQNRSKMICDCLRDCLCRFREDS